MQQNKGASAQTEKLYEAASALIADVRRRYPGEELRCEYMRALDEALATRPLSMTGEGWQPIETAPMWQDAIVIDVIGENAAFAQKAEADGAYYWSVEPESALDWEPTHWRPLPEPRSGEGR